MTIEELLNSYFQRAAKASGQLDIIERAEAERQPVPKLNITVPNYADEVIRPILKMVAEALPEYEISGAVLQAMQTGQRTVPDTYPESLSRRSLVSDQGRPQTLFRPAISS